MTITPIAGSPPDTTPKDQFRLVPQTITERDQVPLIYNNNEYQVAVRYNDVDGRQSLLPVFSIEKDSLVLSTGGATRPPEFTATGDISFAAYVGAQQALSLQCNVIAWTNIYDGLATIKKSLNLGNVEVAAMLGDPVPALVQRSSAGPVVIATGTAEKDGEDPTYAVRFEIAPVDLQRLAASAGAVSLRFTTRHEGFLAQKQVEIAASAVQEGVLKKYQVVQTIPGATPGYLVSIGTRVGAGGVGSTYDELSEARLSDLGLSVTFYDNVQSTDSALTTEILKQALLTRDKWMTDDGARATFLFGDKVYLSGLIGDVREALGKYTKTDRNTKDEVIQEDQQKNTYKLDAKAEVSIGPVKLSPGQGSVTDEAETRRQRTQTDTIDLLNELKDDFSEQGKTLTALRFDDSGQLASFSGEGFNAGLYSAVQSKVFEWDLLQTMALKKSSLQVVHAAPPAPTYASLPLVWRAPADKEVGRYNTYRPEDVDPTNPRGPFTNLPPGKRVVVSSRGSLRPRSGAELWIQTDLLVNDADQGPYFVNDHIDNKRSPVNLDVSSAPIVVPPDGTLRVGIRIVFAQSDVFSVPTTFDRGFTIVIEEHN